MLDLKAKPFDLNDDDIAWVQQTLAGMDTLAKVGQLFCLVITSDDLTQLKTDLAEIGMKPGGFMSRPFPGATVQRIYSELQAEAAIPLLLAANLEKGGDGIAMDGTAYGTPLQVAAANDEEAAYRLGLVCGREGRAVGCNWAFAPVIDIDYNYHNPITNTRTFGSEPERVLRLARAYMRGIQECGLAVSIKHWPGDGVDGRDQHLVTSVNSLSVDEWNASFGMVYQGMIDDGAKTVMAAHIMQPAWSRALRPGIADDSIMPASLAPELNDDLLRGRLGFNGLIVSDATSMTGMTAVMPRREAVPLCITAGCDVFLFAVNVKQDFEFMLQGLENGLLSAERLDEAVTNILALKASLGLHRQQAEGTLVPGADALAVLNCDEHRAWAQACADQAVTLVKDTQALLPLSPERHRRVLLYVLGDTGGYMEAGGGGAASRRFVELLSENGFDVTRFEYPKPGADMWANRSTVSPLETLAEYDLVIYFASLKTASNQTTVRIHWALPMGADAPKFVYDAPTLFVSVDNPYHLQDVPMVKTFVNGYTSNEYVVKAIVERLLGRDSFVGVNPVDPFCGLWDATR